MALSLQDKTRQGGNVLIIISTVIMMLRLKLLTDILSNKWPCRATMGPESDDKNAKMLDLTALVQLNQVFILALRANLFPKEAEG